MGPIAYDCAWVGIDSGREGLWKEPVWTDVIRIIARHQGEAVYDKNSEVYNALEACFPAVAWRTYTKEGEFRPLFRDYPNAWTRTGVLTLSAQKFKVTPLGEQVVAGKVSKSDVFISMFKSHVEKLGFGREEKPFSILAAGMMESPRNLSTAEIYWAIMKNYRPGDTNLSAVLQKKLPKIKAKIEPTPLRRLRNMLTLMRSAGAIESYRRGTNVFWAPLDVNVLSRIAND